MELSFFSESSKRAKAPSNIAQVVHCLVDGCNSDLSQCRDYYRRHKVCELHSKTPRVAIRGEVKRFCQQCSRFHSLVEFDEGKRSCRKRLDGHNRRRRKPQLDAPSRNSKVPSNQQGTRLLSFSNPESFSSATWVGAVKAENNLELYNTSLPSSYLNKYSSLPGSSSQSDEGINQFHFMQGIDHTLSEASFHRLHIDPKFALGNCSSNQDLFSERLNQDVNSTRALSLLSRSPAVARDNGSIQNLLPEPTQQAESYILNRNYSTLDEYPFTEDMDCKPVVSAIGSNTSNNATLHYQGMFQNGSCGSYGSGSRQMHTFRRE